jgi:hypothetical protein
MATIILAMELLIPEPEVVQPEVLSLRRLEFQPRCHFRPAQMIFQA